jgi:hypothetical protein
MKASVANVDLAAGGLNTETPTAPTLVTSANAAALVRAPGSESIIINGEEVVIESKTVNIPAARTPAAQRTAAQVKSIQQAGAALLQQFLASLPAGATSNVTVVNTATGAVMKNLVFDENGNSIDVPVEDIVFLDGPQLSLMIGSDNANITAEEIALALTAAAAVAREPEQNFGDGRSVERFVEVLKDELRWRASIQKQFVDRPQRGGEED